MCILSISIIFCFNPGWNPKRFVRYRLLILYSHVRQCAAAALAGAAAAVAWKSLQKCPRPDSTECASRLCWQGGHRPVRRAGGRQAIASKPDRPSSCKIRHLTPPLFLYPPFPWSWAHPGLAQYTTACSMQNSFYPLEYTPMSSADVWPRLWISFCVWTAHWATVSRFFWTFVHISTKFWLRAKLQLWQLLKTMKIAGGGFMQTEVSR